MKEPLVCRIKGRIIIIRRKDGLIVLYFIMAYKSYRRVINRLSRLIGVCSIDINRKKKKQIDA